MATWQRTRLDGSTPRCRSKASHKPPKASRTRLKRTASWRTALKRASRESNRSQFVLASPLELCRGRGRAVHSTSGRAVGVSKGLSRIRGHCGGSKRRRRARRSVHVFEQLVEPVGEGTEQ